MCCACLARWRGLVVGVGCFAACGRAPWRAGRARRCGAARTRPGAPALDVVQAGLGSLQRSTGLVRGPGRGREELPWVSGEVVLNVKAGSLRAREAPEWRCTLVKLSCRTRNRAISMPRGSRSCTFAICALTWIPLRLEKP